MYRPVHRPTGVGAKNETHARRGSIFASYLKLLPVFIFIIPGIICFALAKSGNIAELAQIVDPDGVAIADKAQAAFPLMVKTVLPDGVRGAVVAGLLAALMSSLAGAFNASSTLFTIDLYKKMQSERFGPSTRVGRPHGHHRDDDHRARLDSRDPQRAARPVRLSAGHPGLPRAADLRRVLPRRVLEAAQRGRLHVRADRRLPDGRVPPGGRHADHARLASFKNGYTPNSFLWIVNNIYFQYYSLLIFLVSSAVMIIVSFLTSEPSATQIQGLTFGTVSDAQKRETRGSWSAIDVVTSCIVMAFIIAAYVYFSG